LLPRAIAGLVASWSAAFVLDPDGVTRTKALGSERMARRLRDALPGGPHPLRAAVWEFLRYFFPAISSDRSHRPGRRCSVKRAITLHGINGAQRARLEALRDRDGERGMDVHGFDATTTCST
jgi:hypothetical protein